MTHSLVEAIFLYYCWNDLSQDFGQKFASRSLNKIIMAATRQLQINDDIDPDYRRFLVDRLQSWEGKDTLITTLQQSKLVLTPLFLYQDDVELQ